MALSLTFSIICGAVAAFGVIPFEKIVFLNVWMLSVPHTLSTFFRQDLRTRKQGGLAVLVIAAFSAVFYGIRTHHDLSALILCYFFAQQFHYSRQNYGFSKLLSSDSEPSRMESFFYPAVSLVSILGALSKGAINFFGFAIRNPLPLGLEPRVVILSLALLFGAFLVLGPRSRRPPALLHLAMNSALFAWSQHFTLIWFMMNVLHNFQYLQLMVRMERSARVLVFPLVLSFILALFAEIPEMILVFLAINFTHYLWDSRIWRGVRVT